MKIFLVGLVLTVLIGCDMNTPSKTYSHALAHPNGLRATVTLEHHSIDTDDKGYVIKLSDPDARQRSDISLQYLNQPPMEHTQQRLIGQQTYHYTLDTYAGGSGGEEYTLTIWKPLQEKGISLRYYLQTEESPSFTRIWELIESATIE